MRIFHIEDEKAFKPLAIQIDTKEELVTILAALGATNIKKLDEGARYLLTKQAPSINVCTEIFSNLKSFLE